MKWEKRTMVLNCLSILFIFLEVFLFLDFNFFHLLPGKIVVPALIIDIILLTATLCINLISSLRQNNPANSIPQWVKDSLQASEQIKCTIEKDGSKLDVNLFLKEGTFINMTQDQLISKVKSELESLMKIGVTFTPDISDGFNLVSSEIIQQTSWKINESWWKLMWFMPTTPEAFYYLVIAIGLVTAIVVLAVIASLIRAKKHRKKSNEFFNSAREALGYDEEGPLFPDK